MKSCYIHIPFCEKICAYCDFCKMFYNEKLVDKYLDELEKEIKSIYNNEYLDTIYIGGGTPSSLNLRQLNKLFEIIKIFKLNDNYEFTIECNFSNVNKEKLELFKEFGINRLSFGLETTNKNNLLFLERNESLEQTVKIIKLAKELGFNNINVDLMYALPGETIEDLKADLNFIKILNIEHISCYSLIIEDHTKLGIKNVQNISEDEDFSMYQYICNWMKNNGYDHYEISNYGKKNFYSRHNLAYWDNKEYYGFGLGAAAFIGNKRINNTRSINKYLQGNYISEIEELSKEDFVYYEIMLNLRKHEGINLKDIYNKYKVNINYEDLLNNGFVCLKDNHLFILEDKWYISNEIIALLEEGVYYE